MLNTINNPYQSDTKRGEITLPASLSLTLNPNLLMKVYNNSGIASFELPTAVTDKALYVMSQYDPVKLNASGEVPSTNENCRLFAYGSGNAGDIIILADPTANSGAQAGMVRSLTGSHAPITDEAYFRFGFAEEAFVDGQYVKVRFCPGEARIASATYTITDNSGGTAATPASGVVIVAAIAAASTDTSAASKTSTANAIATLAEAINKIETALKNQGISL